jgi:aminopeptidase
MDLDKLRRDYATLTVRLGANVAPGQIVAIMAHIEHVDFVRALTEASYEAGARYVDVWYWDAHLKRSRLMNATEDSLDWTPPWLEERYRQLTEERGASIVVSGDPEPDLLADVPPERAGLDSMPRLVSRLEMVNSEQVNWTIVAYPTKAWAEAVFGEPDIERLWGDLSAFMRLDTPDPVAAWEAHLTTLRARAQALNEAGLDLVHFSGPHTDLRVGLIPGSHWQAAGFTTAWGRTHIPNMPTEEVFTTPDMRRTEGVVRATKPLALEGTIVRDLELEFRNGDVVRVDASSGADAIRGQQKADPGAKRLGEVALVDRSSPIGRTGVVYLDTLLDENATSHIAYGAGYANAMEGGKDASESQLDDWGVNRSKVHTDFMIGGPEVNVTGFTKEGEEIPLILDNVWQLD